MKKALNFAPEALPMNIAQTRYQTFTTSPETRITYGFVGSMPDRLLPKKFIALPQDLPEVKVERVKKEEPKEKGKPIVRQFDDKKTQAKEMKKAESESSSDDENYFIKSISSVPVKNAMSEYHKEMEMNVWSRTTTGGK